MTKIIALTGKMGSGKTTALERIMAYGDHTYVKFAGPLYKAQEAVYESLGLPYEQGKLKDRRLLQVLGTDWGRERDPNFWVNQWKETVQFTKGNIITDDCRFLNEAEAVKALGGQVWKIVGPSRGEFISGQTHKSEMEIDLIQPDITIVNDGSLEDLYAQIEFAMNRIWDDGISVKRGSRL